MLLPLLALKRIVTADSYSSFLNETFTVPALILMYSPYCGHCTAIHPTWLELMTAYEPATDVIVGEIGCAANRETCRQLLAPDGYPTFGVFAKGRGTPVHPARTMEGFTAQAEAARSHNLTVPCLLFPSDFNQKFPFFVLEANGTDLGPGCAAVRRLAVSVPRAFPMLYLSENWSKSSMEYRINQTELVHFSGKLEHSDLLEFVREWSMAPLGDWPLEDGFRSRRRFLFFVDEIPEIWGKYEREIVTFSRDIVVGKIAKREFRERWPNITAPGRSVVMFSADKKRFNVTEAIMDHAIVARLLSEFADGKFDNGMTMDSSLLFPAVMGKEAKRTDERKPQSEKARSLGALMIGAGGCSALIILGAVVAKTRTRKVE
jgi:thiol-disulfide isomerase/thioredoxin